MADTLILEVVTPERELAHEQVATVQLPATTGYLGILPGHTPLLTELAAGALSYQKGGATVYIAVLGGIAEVLGDRVTVLADSAERAEEIDPAQARAALSAAEKEMQTAISDPKTDWDALLQAVARAQVRLEVAEHAGAVART